jgi:uncharacterized protein (UPF0303 family)
MAPYVLVGLAVLIMEIEQNALQIGLLCVKTITVGEDRNIAVKLLAILRESVGSEVSQNFQKVFHSVQIQFLVPDYFEQSLLKFLLTLY